MDSIWLLLATVIVISVVLLFQKLIKVSQKYSEDISAFKNVPGLPRHWLLGNVRELTVWSDYLFRMQREFVDEKGIKMYVFWLFNKPVVMVTHPDTAKDIMKSTEPKSLDLLGYGGLLPWLGQSLLILSGTNWERNRRLLTPAFHFDILKPYVGIFNQVADVLVDKMTTAARESQSFEMFKPAGLATLDSLLQCALSYKGKVQQIGMNHPYVTAVNRLSQLVVQRTIHLHHYYDTIYKWSSDGQEFYKLCDFVHDFSEKIISERRHKLEENPDVIKKRHLDFLDILLTAKDEDGQGLSNVEIRNEVDTFMFAGHDTTASVLSWSVYVLAMYPEHQAKLYEDVHNVLGDRQSVNWEDLAKFKYLPWFIKEVMRLHTPVPVTSRILSKPFTVDGITIPSGTHIDLGLFHMHHHPDVWQDPWEFKPERFELVQSEEVNKDPYSFVPFSAGPRNCIGQNFAQNEEKVLIARIVNRFEISLDTDHKVEPYIDAVLRTKTGLYVKLKERKPRDN